MLMSCYDWIVKPQSYIYIYISTIYWRSKKKISTINSVRCAYPLSKWNYYVIWVLHTFVGLICFLVNSFCLFSDICFWNLNWVFISQDLLFCSSFRFHFLQFSTWDAKLFSFCLFNFVVYITKKILTCHCRFLLPSTHTASGDLK